MGLFTFYNWPYGAYTLDDTDTETNEMSKPMESSVQCEHFHTILRKLF